MAKEPFSYEDAFPSAPAAPAAPSGAFSYEEAFDLKPKAPGVLRGAGDSALAFGTGLVQGAKGVVDVFGAGSDTSKSLGRGIEKLQALESPFRQAEKQRRAGIIEEAEKSGSTWDQVKAYAGSFAEAPLDTTLGALGTSAPTLALGLIPGAGQAALATRVAQAGMGAVQGAGFAKGGIYDAVKQEHMAAGMSEAEAEKRATDAQAYGGDNIGNIAGATALGAVAGSTGAESAVRRLAGGFAGRQAAEEAKGGILRGAGKGILLEAPMEGLQGGQERYATNVALQREGFDVPTWQGVAGTSALEMLTGGAVGGGFGALEGARSRPQTKPPGVTDQEWQTALGAGNPDAIRPDAPQIDVPDLTTEAGAAPPRTGMDFTRDVDTSGLSLVDEAQRERERAQTIDFQRPDLTPDWSTSQGAGTPREGLTMPPRQFDTSGLSLKPSEAMGIDPSRGALSKVAAMAVDSGASQAMQPQEVQSSQTTAAPLGAPLTDSSLDRTDSLRDLIQGEQDARRTSDGLRSGDGTGAGARIDNAGSGVASDLGGLGGRGNNAAIAEPAAAGDAGSGPTSPTGGVPALTERPRNWRGNAIPASKVARELGLDPTGKRLAQIVGEIDAVDSEANQAQGAQSSTTSIFNEINDLRAENQTLPTKGAQPENVQNPPQGTAGTQAQAAPVEAQQAAGGDATATAGVPAEGGGRGAQADGMRLGRDSVLLSEGGKPFKTQKAARAALKQQTGMRVVKADGGFVLAPKTLAQIEAQKKAANRLGGVGNSGVPMAAHELLASRGGLSKESMADLGFDRNQKVGAKWLFAGTGGLSLERATEALQQTGYMQGTDQGEAIAMIQRSARGNPVYTPDGYEQMAQADAEAQFSDYLDAQTDPLDSLASDGYTDADMEGAGFEQASPEIQAEVAALSAQLEAVGQDSESILERVAIQYPDATQQEYHEHVKAAITQAIAEATQPASRGDSRQNDGEQRQATGAGEGLTSPTRADIEAQQDRTEQASELDQREQVRRESEVGDNSFMTGFDGDGRQDSTGDLFSVAERRTSDREYLDAVERGDMDAAQKMVDKAARDAGYISGTDYRMAHRAPNSESDVSLVNLRDVDLVPDDYWTRPDWYQGTPEEYGSWSSVTSLFRLVDKRKEEGKRDPGGAMMTVYRAVPKDVKDSRFRNGDWVTPSREYAQNEGAMIPGGYRVIAFRASAKNLWWDGNSIAELGYDDGKSYSYKNTKNNRKLMDVVTRDDDGNIIPLSKRFNQRSDDARFRISNTANNLAGAQYAPAPKAQQDIAGTVRDAINKHRASRGSEPILWGAVTPPDGEAGATFRSIANLAKRIFGREVIYVKFQGQALFNGAVSKLHPGKIFLNIDSERPLMAVLGHELLHELAKSNPGVYANLSRRLNKVIRNENIYSEQVKRKYREQGQPAPIDILEELEADIVGDNFMDPAFWEEVAKGQPGLFRSLANQIMRWLDRIAATIKRTRPFGTENFLSDIAAARSAVADAVREFAQNPGAVESDSRLSVADRTPQTETAAFKRWFGDSKVVDSAGKPLVVYHGTASDITAFDPDRAGENFSASVGGGVYFTSMAKGWPGAPSGDYESASAYAKAVSKDGEGANVLPAYLSLKNPLVIEGELENGPIAYADINKRDIERRVSDGGYDGVVIRDTTSDTYWSGEPNQTVYIAFRPEQIKSAIGNNGDFDPENPDIRFSIADTAANIAGRGIDRMRQAARTASGKDVPRAATMGDLNDIQRSLLSKTGSSRSPTADAIKAATDRAGLKIRQGLVDRYAALKELDAKALGQDFIGNAITDSSWVLAKMSSAGSGALNAMMTAGRVEFDAKEKVIGIKGQPNGGLTATLQKLGGPAEVERFFAWIASNRADALANEWVVRDGGKETRYKNQAAAVAAAQATPGAKAEPAGRENLFTPDEIKAGKLLNEGKTEEGKARSMLYAQAFKEFQEYRDDVLAIAEKAGIISNENRALWRDEFYVPFYRVMQDDGKTGGPGGGKGLSRQEAFKKLKGGKENLNDLMENTLMNFHHLISASLKNQAAVQAITNAEKVGIARVVPESRRDTETSTFVLKNGQKVYYEIDDPLVYESITSLSDPGLNNLAVRTMGAFKRLFTNMITVTPQYVTAAVFRDLLQASSTSPTSKNIGKNFVQGLKTFKNQKTRAEMMASGGAFSFGHIYGMDPDEVKASLNRTVKGAQLISDPSMIPGILRKGWKQWNDAIDTSENISRAATYIQNVEQLGKLRAAFEARDVMDFSQHGAWPSVRFMIRVVPFLNARLQGLDKLYRSGVKPSILTAMGKGTDTDKQAAARFATVTGALTLATMALYMANADDEDYKKLEEWQKDTYWFIKIGGEKFFLPKPFEVGAIATMAERTLQQFMDDKATGALFRERMWEMLMQTFAFNPVPQMFQPMVDVYSNKDAFTGRDIETMGMERLSPGLRARDTTTTPARALSAASRVFGDESPIALSPVQADHMIRGYLGGVGASSAALIDTISRAAMGQESPAKHWYEYQPIKRFYQSGQAVQPNTRYSTLFYDGLREANRVYADVQELQKLGRTEEAQKLITEKQSTLRMRQQLNAQQRRLSDINKRLQAVRRSDNDGEWKRREVDMLNTQKALITERMGKMIEIVRAE